MKTKSARAESLRSSPVWLFSTTTASRVLRPSSSHFGAPEHLDAGMAFDLVDEIARHVLGEVAAAHQEVDLGRVREEHSRLTRRVAATHHGQWFGPALACLVLGCGVVDADPFEPFDIGYGKAAVTGARGDDHRA